MKYSKFLLVLGLLVCCSYTEIYSQKSLGENYNATKISLLTYSPGKKLYSVFGHSAIRIYDPMHNSDVVYNYGSFNFNQPGFYFRFLQGNLIYSLSSTQFDKVKQSLMLENRSLIETPLHLNYAEKVKLIKYLEINILPENRDYRYDFLYDNCATRIIDLLYKSTSDSLVLMPEVLPVETFRQLIKPYFLERPWVRIGIDLLMGIPADKTARLTEPAFLPDYLHLFVKNFQLKNAAPHKFAGTDIVHFQHYSVTDNRKLTPSMVLWPLFILFLIAMLIDSYVRFLFRKAGNIILFLTGLISLLLCYLWIFSHHSIFRFNPDLLWANPLILIAAFIKHTHNQPSYTELKKIILWFTGILVLLGILLSVIIERNTDLLAIGMLVLIITTDKLRSYTSASGNTGNSQV